MQRLQEGFTLSHLTLEAAHASQLSRSLGIGGNTPRPEDCSSSIDAGQRWGEWLELMEWGYNVDSKGPRTFLSVQHNSIDISRNYLLGM